MHNLNLTLAEQLNISKQEIEKRKPLLEQKLEQEKEELKQELKNQGAKAGKSLWQRFKGLFD